MDDGMIPWFEFISGTINLVDAGHDALLELVL